MILIIKELTSSALTQIVTPTKNTIVEAVRPHIYRHNFATGSLQIQIIDDTSTVIATSVAIPISTIDSLAYFHGYVTFNIDAYLQKGRQYTISLTGTSGYSFAEPAYCGWCNGFDLEKYPMNGVPNSVYSYPLDLEIWERIEK